MTYASVRRAAEHIARTGTITPHQLAALSAHDERLTPEQRQQFSDDWRAEGSSAAAAPPIWFGPARKIVAEFEGCKLKAYPDPGTGAAPWTIGYGHTGPEVTPGLTITQQQADAWLAEDLQHFADGIHRLLPGSQHWGGNQQAALISWAFNVGLGLDGVEGSTLRKRLIAGEPGIIVVPQELPRWDKDEHRKAVPGLTRRRAAEVALFTGSLPVQQNGIRLQVPYEYQLDNKSGTGYRECFSSSAAMIAKYYGKVASDDAYNAVRRKYGDTTDSSAQVKALNSLGIKARFRMNGNVALLESELREGRPVMVGWLHKGPVSKPSGGGHWSVVTGFTADAFIHNDPQGEASLLNGGYASVKGGAGVVYSRKNWLPRWLPDGPGSGWCITVQE